MLAVAALITAFSLPAFFGESHEEGEARAWAEARRLEVPPPKPPNCASSRFAVVPDVPDTTRVIEVAGRRLFIPAATIAGAFADIAHNTYESAATHKFLLDRFVPDIHSMECPGTVHVVRDRRISQYYGAEIATSDPRMQAALGRYAPLVRRFVILLRPRTVDGTPVSTFRPQGPGVLEKAGWRGHNPRVYTNDDHPDCRVVQAGVRDMLLHRKVTDALELALVFEDGTVRQEEWVDLCETVPPLFAVVATPNSGRQR